jgi:hypothetical protein
MKTSGRHSALILVILPLLAVQTGTDRAAGRARPEQRPEFQILELRGEVQHVRAATQELQVLTRESALEMNDEIRTGRDGYVLLGLEDGSRFEIFPGSWVRMGVARSSWLRALEIFMGQVRLFIERIGGRPNPYTFSTPTAVLGVRGTILDVLVTEDRATMVGVEEGVVLVENMQFPGRGVTVGRGYRTIVRPNELPLRPERMPPGNGRFGGLAAKHGQEPSPAQSGTRQGGSSVQGSQSGQRGSTQTGTRSSNPGGTTGTPPPAASGGTTAPPKKKKP